MDHTEQMLSLELIDEPTQAMRSEINRDEVFELAADIKKNGLINPITVRPKGERYEVVAGHRRLLAHRYGGMPLIRCIVRELSDDEAFSIMTSENLKRENVNPVDEAQHTQRLMELHNGDVGKVAEIVGRGKDWVENRLIVARMPDVLKRALRSKLLTLGAALALSDITNENDLNACVEMAIVQGASVTMVNYWVAQWKAGLFGSALMEKMADPEAPGGVRQEVMLRCAIDGKQYPAREFSSVLIHNSNVGYIEALRVHLESQASVATPGPVADVVATVTE